MADLVLDTQACVYALSAPAKLGRDARRRLKQAEDGQGTVWIPAALVALRDPFDRLIVSACRAMHAQLVSKDDGLQATGLVQTVWN